MSANSKPLPVFGETPVRVARDVLAARWFSVLDAHQTVCSQSEFPTALTSLARMQSDQPSLVWRGGEKLTLEGADWGRKNSLIRIRSIACVFGGGSGGVVLSSWIDGATYQKNLHNEERHHPHSANITASTSRHNRGFIPTGLSPDQSAVGRRLIVDSPGRLMF